MIVSVIGAGSWGTASAILLGEKGYDIKIWDRKEATLDEINSSRQNNRYLPNINIPQTVAGVNDIHDAVKDADIVVLAIPTDAVRDICLKLKDSIKDNQIFVSLTKGIENGTYKRVSQIIEEYFPNNHVAVISGPSHAEEVSRNIPTAVVCASLDRKTAEFIQDIFTTPNFRVYTNSDIIGVEIGGAVKNIIAIGAGISDGLGFGDNTKAGILTRGITEIARLGEALGADPRTFSGLSGIGDLIVTCTSMHSRNRRAGILIGQGNTVEEATKKVNMVVEGIRTSKAAYELSNRIGVDMPITSEIYRILYEKLEPSKAVSNLMMRDKKREMEHNIRIW